MRFLVPFWPEPEPDIRYIPTFRIPPLQPPPLSCGGRARAEMMGRECPSIILCNATCYHLSAAESAVMHVMWVSWIQQKPIRFDMIHAVSVAIRYRSDNRPFSTLHKIKIWTYKNRNRTRIVVFIFFKRLKLTTNPKMETVTALVWNSIQIKSHIKS